MNKEVLEKIVNIQTGEELDYDKVEGLKDNTILKVRPELFESWDFEKNDELGFDIWKMTKGSHKRAWWTCDLGHSWDTRVSHRCLAKSNCPYCCHNPKVLRGFNDIWTVNPNLAKLLLDGNNGYKYTEMSNERVDWECDTCKLSIKNKQICEVKVNGLRCPTCSDNKPFGEKVIFNILRLLKLEFTWEKIFDWSNDKRYDFYIPECNMIIEVHGEQHTVKGFDTVGGRSIIEEQTNDRYKHAMAMHNRIENYIVIDAQESNISYLKESILKSRLPEWIDIKSINFDEISLLSQKSLNVEILELRNEGFTTPEIISKMNMRYRYVVNVLREWESLGLCTCDIPHNPYNRKKVNQYSLDGTFLKEWESISSIVRELKIKESSIIACCKGRRNDFKGYTWKYA